MQTNTFLAFATLVVSVQAATVPKPPRNRLFAHVLDERHPAASQLSEDAIVVAVQPSQRTLLQTDVESSATERKGSGLAIPPVEATMWRTPIAKHDFVDLPQPIKRADDGKRKLQDFYTLDVEDLQRGPFKRQTLLDLRMVQALL